MTDMTESEGAVLATPDKAVTDDAPHLLIIDDDSRIRSLLSRYLGGQGFRVSGAANSADARRRLAGLAFDLLIVDVMMPGEDGMELTKSLRHVVGGRWNKSRLGKRAASRSDPVLASP